MIGTTAEQQTVYSRQGIDDGSLIGNRRDNEGNASGGHHRLVVALSQLTGQVVIIACNTYHRLFDGFRITGIDLIKTCLQVKRMFHRFSSSSTVMGISRFKLCSSEMSVSVAVTPGMPCRRPLSKSISCSLSLA